MPERDFGKAALRGEPSYVWRAGQERRKNMILRAAGERIHGRFLENGCGVGMYLKHLATATGKMVGLEYDYARAREAGASPTPVVNAAGEHLPFTAEAFDVILSHEVLEHVQDDGLAVEEMVRVLRPGGRIIIFCPNRGYPFETHGIYWRGRYHFGNIPLINYLPRIWRNRLAPHVRVYSARDLDRLFQGLPVKKMRQAVIFGAYDNIIVRFPRIGPLIRRVLHGLENTPLRAFGLSHFWVLEKKD